MKSGTGPPPSCARLETRDVSVAPGDSGGDLANLDDAGERFDRAVERAGGDLIVDAPPSHEPDEARFVLPARAAGEAAGAHIDRIGAARDISALACAP